MHAELAKMSKTLDSSQRFIIDYIEKLPACYGYYNKGIREHPEKCSVCTSKNDCIGHFLTSDTCMYGKG